MWPGITVLLQGTSNLFDGPYLVLQSKHTITNNGYDMQLELMRHTVRGANDPTGEKPESRVVTVTAQGGEDETESAIQEEDISTSEFQAALDAAGT